MSDLTPEAEALRKEWLRREGDQSWTASVLQRLIAGLAVRDEALAAIAALHVPAGPIAKYGPRFGGWCAHCSTGQVSHHDDGSYTHRVTWPCPTQRILSSLERSLDPYRDDKEQRAAVPQDKGSNNE